MNRFVGELRGFSLARRASWLFLLGTSFLSLEAVWAQKVLRSTVFRKGPREARGYLIYNTSFFPSHLFPPTSVQHVRVKRGFRGTQEGFWGRRRGKVGSGVPC